MKASLDSAFLRRLRFIVNFPFPSIADRRRIWEKVFLQEDVEHGLAAPPLGPLDYERLARLNLAGGQIHNVALNAAFAAAHADSNVTMRHILAAARAEFGKLDRPSTRRTSAGRTLRQGRGYRHDRPHPHRAPGAGGSEGELVSRRARGASAGDRTNEADYGAGSESFQWRHRSRALSQRS
jgi:hypothetical protein